VALDPAGVTRRDEGSALRTLRVGVHPDSLVLRSGTDVIVRTPVRPDFRDGNVVDVLKPPGADEVANRLLGVRRLMEPVGVAHLHLRYELPTGEPDDPARVAAFVAAGCEVDALRVLALDASDLPTDVPVLPAMVTLERLEGPDGDVIAGRRWYAAAVLDRYAHGDDVATWRAWDEEWGAWDRERVSALARVGRAEVWLASRHGMPVATLTLVDDRDGMVVIEDVVTHPAHRRRGIARALLGAALASLRGARSLEQVALATHPGAPAEGLYTGFGFAPVADVHAWLRPAPPTAEPPSSPPSTPPAGGA
jgi:GNAT superfamily N-acetyltransferase